MSRTLRAVDLCCGAGGWAAAAAGLPIDFVAVVDRDPKAIETWRMNHAAAHPGCLIEELDLCLAKNVDWLIDRLSTGVVDIIVGGIPCELISSARGSRKVTDDAWREWKLLLDHCLMIARRLSPTWWCFEDTIGIERHLPLPLFYGEPIPFRRIRSDLFGPQRRLRTFVGVFPEPKPDPSFCHRTLGDCLRPGPHLTVARADELEQSPGNRGISRQYIRLMRVDRPSFTITSYPIGGSLHRRTWMIEEPSDNGGTPRRRSLAWDEAAIIQGFPHDYVFVGGATHAWKMIAQAIPIYVGRAIFKAIIRARDLSSPGKAGDSRRPIPPASTGVRRRW